MYERLAKNHKDFEDDTRDHMNEYADAGLRTLVLAYREVSEEEYKEFNVEFTAAKTLSVLIGRQRLMKWQRGLRKT